MDMDDRVLGSSTDSCDRFLEAVDRFTSGVQLQLGRAVSLAASNIAIETILLDTRNNNTGGSAPNATNQPRDGYSFQPSFLVQANRDEDVVVTTNPTFRRCIPI